MTAPSGCGYLCSVMKILIANLGSTSFKYRLFDMTTESVLARGGVERIGAAESPAFVEIGGEREEARLVAKDHAAAQHAEALRALNASD